MNKTYNPQEVEESAQQFWEKKQCFSVSEDLNREKFYSLCMFPYPSGTLHMGHVRNYTLGDVISRYQRAQGKNVLQPIGWDAFGLPAENAAIKHGVHPAKWTADNIAKMKEQFLRLGNAYDWTREFATCCPQYYKWEQWFFIRLYEKGLVYKKNAVVNWDPVDKTVLANEQVIDGKGWRSGAVIERREIPQWFIKITAYAEELLQSIDTLDNWPEQVKQMQRNWIGRSEGCEIFFNVDGISKRLKIYTTRPDTLYGVTSIAISPEHPVAKEAAENNTKIQEFIDSCKNLKTSEADIATMEKRGIQTDYKAHHPLTGEELPVWVANFVLMQYGSGAVMSVPAHDQRDWEFAKKYNIPIKVVINPAGSTEHNFDKSAFTDKGILVSSEQFTDMLSDSAIDKITAHIESKELGKKTVNYRLRDWGVSRQRYWGTPIPMINCEQCGIVPVPEAQLPVELPENIDFTTANPLEQCREFTNTPCPKCGQDAQRETETFDTFMESSWYYARFACNNQDNAMLDDRAKYWTPVDQYVGGIEHAVMHLLYARFFHKLMRDEGLVNSDEPFKNLLTQGMVLKDGQKMSKSVGNVVDPNHLITTYGADTARLFTMFASAPEQSLEWSDAGVEGSHRFLKRLWAFVHEHLQHIIEINEHHVDANNMLEWDVTDTDIKKSRQVLHQLVAQANHDYERQQFNTVVSACMKIFNEASSVNLKSEDDYNFIYEAISILLRLLAPITPHITHHLWNACGFNQTIIDAPWPKVDKNALKTDLIKFVVQVNGKLRGHFIANTNLKQEELIEMAREEVEQFIAGKKEKKAIVVTHRQLINLVIH